ncbi:MAG: VTT domain-containing protein [Anaerolineales bacterium]
MSEEVRQDGELRQYDWRTTALRVLALVAVIAITIAGYLLRNEIKNFEVWGYPGIFLISLISNATIVLPAPGFIVTLVAGSIFNPILVAVAAAAGAALGELTGYLAGYSGRGVFERAPSYDRLKELMSEYGGWSVLVLAAVPNPLFDIAGAAAGALRMPVVAFLIWAFAGKLIKMLAIAYAGALGLDWILNLVGQG